MIKNKIMTLRKQLALGYLLIVLLMSIQSVVTYLNISKNKDTALWTKHTLEVISVGHRLEKQLLEMETGLRGYLLTGELLFLVPFEQGKEDFSQSFNIALQLVSDNNQQVQLLEDIMALETEWIEQVAHNQIAARNKIKQGHATMQDISTLIADENGYNFVDKLGYKLITFINNEEKLLKGREINELNADRTLMNQIFFGSLFTLLMAIVLIYFTMRRITGQINDMTELAKQIASGDLSQKINSPGVDEIGDLARSINVMVDRLNEISGQADAIANGDYSIEVKQNNDNDRLAIALNEMKNQVQERTIAMQESEKKMQRANDNLQLQNILKSQVSQITDLTQGATDIPTVSNTIISELAKMTDSGHGALYITKHSDEVGAELTLKLIASYAFDHRKNSLSEIYLGQGLVGQCAKEKEQILITNAPSDYVQIYSGLGEKSPLNIIVTPITFESKLIAVIELASFSHFSESKIEMLQLVSNNIGAVFNNMQNLAQTKKLLQKML